MKNRDKRMAWWKEARFALFMHWGAYSVLGGEYKGEELKGKYAEHIARICKIPRKDYIRDAAGKFHPEKYDAERWVLLAKKAGMKYIVITSKHHDGFAIYYSKHSDFDMKDTAKWHRDPLKELADACRKHGLRFGVYYSHAQDWYEPGNVRNNWDFPGNPAVNNRRWFKKKTPEVKAHLKKAWTYYETKVIPQVKELIIDYKVDMIWFDTASWMPQEYNTRVLKAVRDTNPDTIVSHRIGGGMGDYVGGPDSPVVFPVTKEPYWEAIQSTLHSWGYNRFDEANRRPPDYLIRMLATVVSKGGNMMINVGPKPDGTFVKKDIETLEIIAEWMKEQSGSIHGAGRSPLPAQNWGVITSKGNDLFLHVFNWPKKGKLRVGGLFTKVDSATLLKKKKKLKVKREPGNVISLNIPTKPSHPFNSVIQLKCASKPKADQFRLLEPGIENRLHVYDTGLIQGRRIRTSSGKGSDAYLFNWREPDASVTWKVRATEPLGYKVHIIYDFPKKNSESDYYKLTIGNARLAGKVRKKGTGDQKYIKKELALMRMHSVSGKSSIMTIDHLGTLSLNPGTYDLKLSAIGNIKNRELFRPRSIILEPADKKIRTSSVLSLKEAIKAAGKTVPKGSKQKKRTPSKMTISGSFKPDKDSIVLKAEDAKIIGEKAEYEKGRNKDNIGRWFGQETRIKWEFNVPRAGKYELGITFACQGKSAGSLVDFITPNQKVSFTVEETGSWNEYVCKKIGALNFTKAGKTILEVVPRKKPGSAVMNLHNVILK